MTNILCLLLVAAIGSFDLIKCEIYLITPSSSDSCPEKSCLTLSQFAANTSSFLDSNTIMVFLPGNHTLDRNLSASSVSSFRMLSDIALFGSLSDRPDTSITCETSVMFNFDNITQLYFSGIQFVGCGGNKVESVHSFILDRCSFIGQGANKSALELIKTTAKIERTSFISNNNLLGTEVKYYLWPWLAKITVGGAIIVNQSSISIFDSKFQGNRAVGGGAIYSERNSNISIVNSTFVDNNAMGSTSLGGAMYLHNTNLSINMVYFDKNSADGSGGVFYGHKCTISSINNHFGNNRAVFSGGVYFCFDCMISNTNSYFGNNKASNGGVMYLYNHLQVSLLHSKNNSFHNNRARWGGVMLWHYQQVNSSNDYFYNNSADDGGVFRIYSSIMNSEWNHFNSNTAKNGGVIYCYESTINSNNDYFNNNRADYNGGAITMKHGSKLYSRNDTFINSRAGRKGGAIGAWNSTINSSNDLFHKNIARRGGVMWAKRSTLKCSSVKFLKNKAGRKGGVMWARLSTIISSNDSYYGNRAHRSGGVMWVLTTTVHSYNGNYSNNMVSQDGGVVVAYLKSNIHSQDDYFYSNRAGSNGGTISSSNSKLFSNNGYFYNNSAGSDGGVLWAYDSTTESYSDTFFFNSAGRDGGVVYSHAVSSTYEMITAYNNTAGSHGGVLRQLQGSLKVKIGNFSSNAAKHGGVMHLNRLRLIQLNETLFSDTTADMGSVFYACGSDFYSYGKMTLLHNTATSSVAYFMDSSVHLSGNTTLSDNKGSIIVTACKVNFTDYLLITGGKVSDRESVQLTGKFEEGGAITAIQSNVVFDGECKLSDNQARNGGAIRSVKSTINVIGELTIANNSAAESGGGIHLYQSELTCQLHSKLVFSRNTASTNGGGMHAISSSININSNRSSTNITTMLLFVRNTAELGGGAYLQLNSVIYIRKYAASNEAYNVLSFTDNRANYGGAVFIPDNTEFGECTEFENNTHSISNECPFQVISFYGDDSHSLDISKQNIHFTGNTARSFGSSLYGSLFDSCTLSHLAEGNITNDINVYPRYFSPMDEPEVHEIRYLQDVSDITTSEIGTSPVKLCFCKDDTPNCTYQHPPMHTDRRTVISLAIFDEVGNIVRNGDVLGYFNKSRNGSFLHVYKHQYRRNSKTVKSNCTDFVFSAFSIHPFDDLILRVDSGPCERSMPQEIQVVLQFPSCNNCTIGFQRFEDQEKGCRCDCHEEIRDHLVNCNATTQTLQKRSSAWISYINDTDKSLTGGFIIHPHCPLDYCTSTDSASVYINFNDDKGADAQCAYNRSGTLCGACPPNLSLSLGSSKCLSCPKLWPILTVVLILLSVLSGIALVALILFLNLTVAVGTINAIIFYANIVAANSKILLPFSEPNFATVLISWLNLEFGLDACFFKGMDIYWKTWLQIALPAYVIFLVAMVFIISERSMKFAHLIGKRNPIATLTTLILLSYTNLLHTIVAAFSFTTVKYPDGSRQTVWLPDGTVSYLSGKHIALFIAAVFILILGIVYTGLLFSWQWLLRYQHKKIFKWVGNQKLCQFLEPYHAPYNFKHRYWTGLLLLIRVVLYTVSAINVSGDPRVALVSTICLVGFLPLLKGFLVIRIYKSTPIDLMETLTYFNLMLLSAFSWYSLETDHYAREAVAYTSVLITFISLITVLIYHIYKYTGAITKLKSSTFFNRILILLQVNKEKYPKHNHTPVFNKELRVEPTYSVVEIHHPILQTSEGSMKDPNLKSNVDSHIAETQTLSQTESDNNEASPYSSPQYSKSIHDTEQIGDTTGLSSNNHINSDSNTHSEIMIHVLSLQMGATQPVTTPKITLN